MVMLNAFWNKMVEMALPFQQWVLGEWCFEQQCGSSFRYRSLVAVIKFGVPPFWIDDIVDHPQSS